MNPYGGRTLCFHNVTEVDISWNLNSTTTATQPTRIQTMHTSWMAKPGTNEIQEAIWNSYEHKILKSYSWKIDNMRLFIETTTVIPATSPQTVPTTDTQIVEMPEWVIWYWRQQTESETTPPTSVDEGRFSKVCLKNCHSKIWGKVPVSCRNATMDSYSTAFATTSGSWINLDNYLAQHMNRSYDNNMSSGVPNASGMPCPDIWVMPDDPYPAAAYTAGGVTRTVRLYMTMDVHSYARWNLFKPQTH